MKNIDLFIVDAGKTVRKRLQEAVEVSSGITITASRSLSESHQIKKEIAEKTPDVLVLGIDSMNSKEMKLFGFLRRNHPQLPVMILIPHNRTGAKIAIFAIKRGAVEFFPKTTTLSESVLPVDFFKNRVVPVINVVPRLNRNILLSWKLIDTAVKNIKPIPADFFKTSLNRMELLIIAGCLGGVASLYLLLSGLPKNLPVPVIVLQHTVEVFSEVLAEDLNLYTDLKVKEAQNGDELKPGCVYIAPGDYHVLTKKINQKNVVVLNHGAKVAGFRPSIDILLQSSAQQFGKRVLAVYLSGGGNDGIEGAKAFDIIGGQIIVQNRSSSLLSDISWNIETFGIPEGSYPLERLGHEISNRLL